MILATDKRQQGLYDWVTQQLSQSAISPTIPWEPLLGDAGVRRYFRVPHGDKTYLAVDSQPQVVDNPRFIAIAEGLAQAGLHVPQIYAAELTAGFLLINELSTQLYSDVLTAENADDLYNDAFSALLRIQASQEYFSVPIIPWEIAEYYNEMQDMITWLLERHLHINLSATQQKALAALFKKLIENMEAQPQVCVHRDYHARNLLYCPDHNPGIIDFQGLFYGPITYDLVSLVRDAYVVWPWARVEKWIEQFYLLLLDNPNYHGLDKQQFDLWFHGMSLQRGIKVLGRFARLCHRDNKPRYLADLPAVAQHVLESCPHFSGTAVLTDLLQEQVIPLIKSPQG